MNLDIDRRFLSGGTPEFLARVGICLGGYAAVVGGLIQFVLLPYILPGLHAGNGLMANHDWVGFHRIAADLAAKVHLFGWPAWQLRPEGQGISGILALLYVWGGSHPWLLLPVNALLFAGGGTALVWILHELGFSRRAALLGSLPFALFPSAAMIYSQIHKDVFSVAGILWSICGWLAIMRGSEGGTPRLRWGIFLTGTGTWLAWLVRPYLCEVLFACGLLSAVYILVRQWYYGGVVWGNLGAVTVALVFAATPLFFSDSYSYASKPAPALSAGPSTVLDSATRRLAQIRLGFTTSSPGAGSNIDVDVQFHDFGDVVRYVPRALQIALLAPFPNFWLKESTSPSAWIERGAAVVEMVLCYFSLSGLLLAWRNRVFRRYAIIPLIFAFALLTLDGLTIANVGTLYRMRYPMELMLVAFGLASIVDWRLNPRFTMERLGTEGKRL